MMQPVVHDTRQHSLKLMLWLAIGGMIMFFAALTSALLARQSQGDWQLFYLPPIFWINTAVLLLSSFTMHRSVQLFREQNASAFRPWISATAVLGLLFLLGQVIGWALLTKGGIVLRGNASGAYLYVISGAHAAHVAGGVLILLVTAVRTYFRTPRWHRLVYLQLTATYWHFVDILWLYLVVFFQFTLS